LSRPTRREHLGLLGLGHPRVDHLGVGDIPGPLEKRRLQRELFLEAVAHLEEGARVRVGLRLAEELAQIAVECAGLRRQIVGALRERGNKGRMRQPELRASASSVGRPGPGRAVDSARGRGVRAPPPSGC